MTNPYLSKDIEVPFEQLFADPNNPRLPIFETGISTSVERVGYDDPKTLFNPEYQIWQDSWEHYYKISDLMTVILKQGWIAVDPIFVWQHPEVNDKFVVCEGNTRLWALRRIREEFLKKEALLNDIESKGSRAVSRNRIDELRKEIDQQRMVIEQTKILQVKPIAAKDTEQLKEKLSIVLGVRHLNGAKKWHNYPESMYLYNKYQRMFIDEYGEDEWIDNKRIEPEVLKKQAQLDSLEPPKLKKKIIAASRHTVFRELYRINVEQAGNTFRDGDHFLFENLGKNNDVRNKFGFEADCLELPAHTMKVLFEWTFKKPRASSDGSDDKEEENPNIFHAHRNIYEWNKIIRHDNKYKTSIANGKFEPDEDSYEDVPPFSDIIADYRLNKSVRDPVHTIERAVDDLKKITSNDFVGGGQNLENAFNELESWLKVNKSIFNTVKAMPEDRREDTGTGKLEE